MLPIVHSIILIAVSLSGGESGFRPVDFKSRFGKYEGCFVIKEVGTDTHLRFNEAALAKRQSPCSTFKIPSALIGLETGVLQGPDTLFKWDGKTSWNKAWERDHTLASAIKESCVWYFQEVARRIGMERMKQFIDRFDYGNRDLSGGIDRFWLTSTLEISANEQLAFMEKLYTNKLPVSKRTVETMQSLLVYREGKGWTFSGKTGTAGKNDKTVLGWFVGHVRSGDKQYVFAVNMTAADKAWGPKARDITFEILADLGLVTR
ncbi:MAG: penicillin-binding transpeptidase domain-containing protein [Planctomycetota bacterium]